jgi:2-iminoacetate synthase
VSFSSVFHALPIREVLQQSLRATPDSVRQALAKRSLELADFPTLISPVANDFLEQMCQRSRQITQQRFGRVIRFFAPLYLSNECINNCKYCGFSRDNPILRVTLSIEEMRQEAREIAREGFRSILLVAGEHPRFVSNNYLRDCVLALRDDFPSIALEVGPMETEDYRAIADAGAEGLVVYQETYDQSVYSAVHTAGPKRDFNWRLDTADRAHAAGFRRLGIGALYGLADWRYEAICLAFHAQHLLRRCWSSQVTLSLPRLRPHAGEFEPLTHISNRAMVQLICALRMVFPDVGLVLSTREPAALRDGLFPIGITHISAGSHTEPGGYTGAGKQNLHLTQRGRMVALPKNATRETSRSGATGQFQIADERSPSEVAAVIENLGYEAIWKDWDAAISA